jgi:hypothetical protein
MSIPAFGLQNVDETIWPQRLLCIRNWTSYEVRREGSDVYYANHDKNPNYAILSYTWGRYRADGDFNKHVLPEAEAIRIFGTDWDIPKIDPREGFGSDAFKAAIKASCSNLDYIWLDVACINQHLDTDNQIGQQASIFHRALKATIWLHRQKQENENTIADAIEAMIHEIASPNNRAHQKDQRLVEERLKTELMVNQLLRDPWFSSLWTLQESFLRKDATILARNGEATHIKWKGVDVILNLYTLLDICKAYLELDDPPGNFHILQAMREAGLDTMMAGNPLVLLRSARQRTTIKMNDRILGIQQIFGVDVSNCADYSQAEIEQELSIAINSRCPSLSQAFLHPYPASEGGPKWQARLGRVFQPRVYSSDKALAPGSHMPHRKIRKGRNTGIAVGVDDTMYIPPDFHFAHEVESPHRASVLLDLAGKLQCTGVLFALEELWHSWRGCEQARCPPGMEQGIFEGPNGSPDLSNPYINAFNCSMYLDDTWASTSLQIVNIMPYEFSRYGWPLMMVHQLCISRPGMVEVLILGRIESIIPGPESKAWIGLLVKVGGNNCFDRIGFCTWKEDIGLDSSIQTRLLN